MGTELHDYSNARPLYEDGFTVREIAWHYGVSRVAMYRTLKRQGVVFTKTWAKKIPNDHIRRALTRRGKR